MSRIRISIALALAMIILATSACVSPPPRAAVSTQIPLASSTPQASPIPQTASAPAATVTPVPDVSLVEDCMAGCHPPDPNEMIAAGAMPMPADHQGRTACLECHAVSGKGPLLPATHLGRLDPSCNVCHQ